MRSFLLFSFLFAVQTEAKTFQNSYVSFDVPDNWACLQEGVAWTCTPSDPKGSREAVIVLAAKVAAPEDNIVNFLNFLREPKKIKTRVGTPMPSQVMYCQQRKLGNHTWVQAQHLGSEIEEYYTLYLATVKEQLAILVSFSAEKNTYKTYNPIFDRAIKTLKITASQKLLIPKMDDKPGELIGIRGDSSSSSISAEDPLPPPQKRGSATTWLFVLALTLAILGGAAYYFNLNKKSK